MSTLLEWRNSCDSVVQNPERVGLDVRPHREIVPPTFNDSTNHLKEKTITMDVHRSQKGRFSTNLNTWATV